MFKAFSKHALRETVYEWSTWVSDDDRNLLTVIGTSRVWTSKELQEVGEFIQGQTRDGWFQTGCNSWHGKFYADYHVAPQLVGTFSK